MNSIDLYNDYEKNEHGTFKDKEITQSFIQDVMNETLQNHKYVIKLKKNKVETPLKQKVKATNTKKVAKEEIVDNKIDQMNKTFESMMVQFQHMVQLNQLIQMNQMNQMQIMNQLLELKSNVIETREDLSYKLKEINGQINNIKDVQESQNNKIIEISNKRASSYGRKPKDVSNEMKETNIDCSHLYPMYKENIFEILDRKDLDIRIIKTILTSKNISGFIKIFNILYKSTNIHNVDIYPIRVVKAKTFQYYNEYKNWIFDTNGVNIMNIICSNISLLLIKVNNDLFESGDFNETLFMDNQNFIEELDDKKIRIQLLLSIKDLIINHTLNYKENKQENYKIENSKIENSKEENVNIENGKVENSKLENNKKENPHKYIHEYSSDEETSDED